MKVVVAGGSGLIGRALCPALRNAGHDPVVLTRGPSRHLADGTPAVTWRPPGDGPWTAELAGAGAVVNLAGETVGHWPWTPSRKRALRDSRTRPTRALVDAIAAQPRERRPRVLLNASGTDVYEGRDAEAAAETAPVGDSFLARLSLEWEAEARRAEDLGLRVVLLRTSLVVAPGASSLRLLALPFRLYLGGRIGSGRQWISWIDLVDAVGLIVRSLESEAVRGPINLAAPDPRRQVDFGRALGGALGRPSWFETPAWAIRLALGDMATLALGSRRVWPEKALALGYSFRRPRLEEALAAAFGKEMG
jgi:uncharacterized protein (TIGR01777 family)